MSFQYELTIGLIVKNEAEHLDRCIKSLEKLRKEISCQLIITDTGSTDGTQDIAKKHADVYLEFPWNGDFSAARNTGVEASLGRWFVFFDADEFLDIDCDDLINFFKDPKHNEYNYCDITLHNYNNSAYTDFYKSTNQRFFNFSGGKRYFEGVIHEAILITGKQYYSFKTILHHTGYLGTKYISKIVRNDKHLLESIENDVNDLRSYMHLGVSRKSVESITIYEESLKNNQDNNSPEAVIYKSAIIALLAKAYYNNSYHQQLQALADKYIKDNITASTINLDILLYLGLSNMNCGYFEKAITYFDGFQKMYQALNQQNQSEILFIPYFHNNNKKAYLNNYLYISYCYFLLNDKEKSYQALEKSEALSFLENDKPVFLSFYIDMLINLKRYSDVKKAYLKFCDNEETRKYVISIVEKYLNPNKFYVHNFELSTAFYKEIEDGYVALSSMRLSEDRLKDQSPELIEKIKSDPLTYKLAVFSPLVYDILESNNDILGFVDNCSAAAMTSNIKKVFTNYADYPIVVYNYLSKKDVNANYQNKELLFIKNLAYLYIANLANVHKTMTPTKQQVEFILDVYIDFSIKIANRIYDLEKVSNNLDIVPSDLACAIVLFEARKYKQTDTLMYIKLLKKALLIDQTLFKYLMMLIQDIEQSCSQPPPEQTEFLMLAKNIKSEIKSLAFKGDKSAAKAVLDQYIKINPNDNEIAELENICR